MKQLAESFAVAAKSFSTAMEEFSKALRHVHRTLSPDVPGVYAVRDYE